VKAAQRAQVVPKSATSNAGKGAPEGKGQQERDEWAIRHRDLGFGQIERYERCISRVPVLHGLWIPKMLHARGLLMTIA
jgi:hypothetical protein